MEFPGSTPICSYLQPCERSRTTSVSRAVSIRASIADVDLVARPVGQRALACALEGARHLVLAAHERAVLAKGAGHALARIVLRAGRFAAQNLAAIVEIEAAFAAHHVGD